METEILQQILAELKELKQGQAKLEQGQTETNSRLERVEQKVTKLEVTLETETNVNIRRIAEGHLALNNKLDELKDLNEKVISIQTETSVHKTAIKELFKRTAE